MPEQHGEAEVDYRNLVRKPEFLPVHILHQALFPKWCKIFKQTYCICIYNSFGLRPDQENVLFHMQHHCK